MQYVDPVPDGNRSTATVFLADDGLPALDRWDEQFRRTVHDSYLLRGVEVRLSGTVEARNGALRSLVGAADARRLTVTGPLHQTEAGYQLQVRLVES